jgi:hypothetical protein
MLYDRRGDEDLERSMGAIRTKLASAKERVRALYPGGCIRWILETREWIVIDGVSRETIEASLSLDDLAVRPRRTVRRPASGTYRQPG